MDEPLPPQTTTNVQDKPPEISLVSIPVTDDNAALNILVGFIGVAQKRGAFNIQESAKLWECIQRFTQQS
jgi:hypothetical protein